MGGNKESRWEWRIFSDAPFTALAPLFSRLKASNHKRSRDIYLISDEIEHGVNIKIRGGIMDAKLLLDASPTGVERWSPLWRCGFPPEQKDLPRISGTCGAGLAARLTRGGTDDTENLRFVAVDKDRSIYIVENTIIEVGTADFPSVRMYTICAEGRDLALVEQFARGCRMERELVASYPAMLRRVLERSRPGN